MSKGRSNLVAVTAKTLLASFPEDESLCLAAVSRAEMGLHIRKDGKHSLWNRNTLGFHHIQTGLLGSAFQTRGREIQCLFLGDLTIA